MIYNMIESTFQPDSKHDAKHDMKHDTTEIFMIRPVTCGVRYNLVDDETPRDPPLLAFSLSVRYTNLEENTDVPHIL